MVTLISVQWPGQRFVHGVVDHLINQVMQPGVTGGADVHRRTETHGLQAFENFDATGIVNCADVFCRHTSFLKNSLEKPDQIRMGMIT